MPVWQEVFTTSLARLGAPLQLTVVPVGRLGGQAVVLGLERTALGRKFSRVG